MKIILLAFFILSGAARASADVLDRSLSLEVGSFATHWADYHNVWVGVHARTLEQSATRSVEADILIRSDSTFPVLGNLGTALYQPNSTLHWGRAAALPERSLLSLDRYLNQRVCQTPFDCATGGPIGVHYRPGAWRLSFEVLNLPNYSPVPRMTAGALVSKYRWTETPYQFVDINGRLVPLRVTSNVNLSAATLLTPGLIIESPVWRRGEFLTSFVASTQRSKSPYTKSSDGLLVIQDERGELTAVVNSDKQLSYPWQTLMISHSEWRPSDLWSLSLDAGTRFSRENAHEIVLGARREGERFDWHVDVGAHRQGRYDFRSASIAGQAAFGAYTAKLITQWIFTRGAASTLVFPEIHYAVTQNSSLYLRGLLIASDPGEILYAKLRAQDHILLGARHAF